MTYDMHRRRDFNIAVRPPQKEHHRPATPPQTRPNRPQIHPDRPSGDHRRPSVPQARPDRPKKDQNNKHDGRPSRRGQNSQVDKDRHENRRITPSGRDVRRGMVRKKRNRIGQEKEIRAIPVKEVLYVCALYSHGKFLLPLVLKSLREGITERKRSNITP